MTKYNILKDYECKNYHGKSNLKMMLIKRSSFKYVVAIDDGIQPNVQYTNFKTKRGAKEWFDGNMYHFEQGGPLGGLRQCAKCKKYNVITFSIKKGHSCKSHPKHICRNCIPDYQFNSSEGEKDNYEME